MFSFSDGDENQKLLLLPHRSFILAFSLQPAKAKPLKRWLRLRLSAGLNSGSGNHLHIAVQPLTENLEHGRPPAVTTMHFIAEIGCLQEISFFFIFS